MSTIDLYNVLRMIPNITDEQAKRATDAACQSGRLDRIEQAIEELKAEMIELRTSMRWGMALLLAVLMLQIAPYFQ